MNPILFTLLLGLFLLSDGPNGHGAPSKISYEGQTESPLRETISDNGTISARAILTPPHPQLSDELTLTIIVVQPETGRLEPTDFGATYGNFQILAEEPSKTAISGGIQTTSFSFKLRANESGLLVLPPIPLTIFEQEIEVTPAESKRIAILIPPGKITIRSNFAGRNVSADDLSGPARLVKRYSWLVVTLLVLLTVLIFAVLLYVLRKKKTPQQELGPTPLERATSQLNELMESKIYVTNVKEFYLRITAIVRWYIEEVTGVRAPEQTTGEFLREITNDLRHHETFDQDIRARLRDFLEFSDLVKFAKFRPSLDEIFSGYKSAQTVVEYRFPQNNRQEEPQ